MAELRSQALGRLLLTRSRGALKEDKQRIVSSLYASYGVWHFDEKHFLTHAKVRRIKGSLEAGELNVSPAYIKEAGVKGT